jgi:hypothetical protein
MSGTARPDGAACDDGIACTDTSICTNGVCGAGQANCATSDLCVPMYCDVFSGTCQGAPVACKNGDFNGSSPGYPNCWSSICNSATGKCEGKLNTAAPYCGDECAVDSDCGGIQIACVDGHCGDDGSACSADADCGIAPNACVIASCSYDQSGLKRCVYNDVWCDDSKPCTRDTCDPLHGCAHHALDPAVACDDGDACTTDTCDATTGCEHTPLTCPAGQTCTAGACVPTCAPAGTIDATGCFTSSTDCDVNFGSTCCSGNAANVAQACPIFAGLNACACL